MISIMGIIFFVFVQSVLFIDSDIRQNNKQAPLTVLPTRRNPETSSVYRFQPRAELQASSFDHTSNEEETTNQFYL